MFHKSVNSYKKFFLYYPCLSITLFYTGGWSHLNELYKGCIDSLIPGVIFCIFLKNLNMLISKCYEQRVNGRLKKSDFNIMAS